MKSKINYKKPDSNSYDGAKADRYTADEFSFVSQHSTNTHVSGRPDEEKVKQILPTFACLVNLDLDDARQMILTIRAMEYADTTKYIVEPKTHEESIMNEIFFLKATCYWKRKMLSINDVKQIQAIQKHEHWEVMRLKSKLPPDR